MQTVCRGHILRKHERGNFERGLCAVSTRLFLSSGFFHRNSLSNGHAQF